MGSDEEERSALEREEEGGVPEASYERDDYEHYERHAPEERDADGEDEDEDRDGDGDGDGGEERRTPTTIATNSSGGTPRSRRGRPPGMFNASTKPPSRPGTPPPLEIPRADGTEKGNFLHDLYSFMVRIGQPITKIPHLGYQELNLYRLYQLVIARGGMDEVTRRQEWKTVYQELGIPTMSTSASYNTRTNYKKHLYLYELEHCDFNDRRPPEAEPKFAIGEYVRIVSSNYEGQVFYAKVLKCRWRQAKNYYYVHYNGWSSSHDEWMPEMVLNKLLPGEALDPEALINPHPNRSSKSNYIIGEPPITTEHKNHRTRKTSGTMTSGSAGATTSTTATEESEAEGETEAYIRGKSTTPTKRDATRSLRLKLRGREQQPHQSLSGSTTASMSAARGPSAETIQSELDKLEDERFLEYHPPARPRFLTVTNVHRYNEERPVGRLRQELLQAIDLRVPNIDELVGEPPIKPDGPEIDKVAPTAVATGAGEETDRKDNIAVMEKELKAIKQEYRRKRKLLDLYYGPSEESSSGAELSSNADGTGGNCSNASSDTSSSGSSRTKIEATAPMTSSPKRLTRRSK